MPPLQTIAVNCNHCGATLQVDEKTRFVTCSYCHSRLSIQRSDSAVFTEVLEKIQEQTGHMAENLELIKLQNELEQIDREWMMSRENFMVNGRNGGRSEPSIGSGVFAIVAGVVFGVIWITTASSHAPPFFTLFGLLVVGGVIFGGINMINKSGRLDEARQAHEMRRSDLIARIEAEKNSQMRSAR